jgi:hypothetical protein
MRKPQVAKHVLRALRPAVIAAGYPASSLTIRPASDGYVIDVPDQWVSLVPLAVDLLAMIGGRCLVLPPEIEFPARVTFNPECSNCAGHDAEGAPEAARMH